MKAALLKSKNCLSVLIVLICFILNGQEGIPHKQHEISVSKSRPINFDVNQFLLQLDKAPDLFSKDKTHSEIIIELPLPDGRMKKFQMYRTQTMHPDLAAKFPEIQTWHGKCKEDGISVVSITATANGLNAMIIDDKFESSFIERDNKDDQSSYVSKYDDSEPYMCQHSKSNLKSDRIPYFVKKEIKDNQLMEVAERNMGIQSNPVALGDKLRTHRFAVAATGEFTNANGGVSGTMAVIVGLVNQLNLLYIREFAINFQLIPNNNLIIYTDPATDPYNNDGNIPDLQNNNNNINATIGSANYDIGHLMQNPPFCPGGCGGWAGAGPCVNSEKAKGMSVNDFVVMRHEMGHQFDQPHTTDSPFPERFEHPAIGNTIQGGNKSDNLFFIYSVEKASAWVEAPGYCVPGTNTNNTIPVVTAGTGGMSIPKSTPFQLSGSATDPDPNTTLLYNWQQYNNEMTYNVVNDRIIPVGNVPVFRNFNPTTTGNVRTIPRLEDLVSTNPYPYELHNGDTLNWETLPNYSRSLTFRLVARDFELTGGAFDYDELTFSVDGNSGPFVVTSPNTGNPTWTAGNNVTVTWNVANTNNAPVNCANVKIKLSVDGGYTYPITLVTNTPNDGTQTFTLPVGIPATTTARVRVECATYTNVVFFDISNQNFTINSLCVAKAGIITPASNLTATQGDPQLNLNLTPLYGLATPSLDFLIDNTLPDNGIFSLLNAPDFTTCIAGCCGLRYRTQEFQVDKAGSYTFFVNFNGETGFFSLYQNSYIPNSPCTNFISALGTLQPGGVGHKNPVVATLLPGITYVMTFQPWFDQYPITGSVNFTNSVGGTLVLSNLGPPAPPASDYAYTYVAINQATGLIVAINQQADFTGLAAGTYHVHGLSYKSANPPPAVVNPNDFLNMSLDAALAMFQCISFSANFAKVVVEPGASGTPSLAISATDANKAEGNTGTTAFTFTVTRTGSTTNQSTAAWAVTGSGANPANGADFSGGNFPSGTVTFPAGSAATQTITVNVNGDTDVEPNEGFTVTLSNPVNATITTATANGTIQNDDGAPVPSIAIAATDANKAEGNAGTTAFTFTVTRTGSTTNQSTAAWAVTGSGANPANGADFSGGNFPSGTVTFPAGSAATQTITVNVNGDTDVEPNEGFTVTLSNPVNATITTAMANGTIQNDDAAPAYCAAGATATTDEKISNVQFNTINNPSGSTSGYEDFTAISTTVQQGSTHAFTGTISNGWPSDQIIVWIDYNQDLDFGDPGEEVFISPTGTGPHSGNITIPQSALTGNTRMRVRLHDTAIGQNATPCGNSSFGQVEDYTINIITSTPSISIAATDANKAEGNAGTTAFTFTVTRTGSTTNQSTAAWAVTGSGANPANGADFSGGNLPTGTVTFPAGSAATQTITVNVNGDTDVEPNEGFTVTLSNPVNATITTAMANGTIQNDDTPPIPSISIAATDANKAEGNAGTTAFTFTVTRTGSTTNQSTAAWAVTGSGANPANGADFSGGNLPTGTVTFPAGSAATQTINVNVNGDLDVEPNEGFTVTLSNPVNATITTATTSGIIQNDDAAPAYCAAGATWTTDEKISNVQFNTINNPSSSTSGYEDFTAISTTVQQGSTHAFTGTISNGYSSDQIIVWIDYNQDLDFGDPGEQVFISPTGTGPHSGNITIPQSALTGNTRMRVRLHDTANSQNATPCGNSGWGQVEDYTINIIASVPSISIAATDANKAEGNAGTTAFTFTVTRTGSTTNQSTAAWAVTGSGANPANGADFSGGNFPSGTVAFPAGSSATQIITVNVNGDTDVEPDEGFTVTLSNPVNATITTAVANGTIQNDDTPPVPSISIAATDANKAEGNAGTTAFTFTVTRTGSTTNQSTAAWAVTGSGANPANGADFSGGNLPTGTVTFPAGSAATQTITVNVNGDTTVEPNEGFTVTLSNPVNATITTAMANGTIQNDDAAPAYCAAGATATTDEKISNVQFNTINNPSGSTSGYEDFTAISTTVQQGSTHAFTGTISNGYSSDQIIVWIDYNQDLDFGDPGEQVFISPTGTGPHSGNITIPQSALTGNTRMRVRLHDTANSQNATPCGNSGWGQVEDYTINIIPAVPIVQNVSASPDYVCSGGNTILNVTAGELVTTPSGGSIIINDNSIASPYPDNIVVNNVPGLINNLKVIITNLSHTFPADIDIVLFGPTGAHSIIFTDAIGDYPGINGTTYTFQTGSTPLPNSGFPASGTYGVVNGDSYSGTGTPSPVTDTGLEVFNGTNPNGTWSLYVFDDTVGDFGSMGSWSLEITTNTGVQATEYSWSPTTFLNNPNIDSPSASGVTATTTYTVTVSTSLPVTFDGVITEAAWGTALATSAGGPSPGFGAGHEINALYMQGNLNDINLGVAGNVTYGSNANEILVFIDSKAGGYPDGNFGRANGPIGILNFNSGTTFDSGFEPDYCLVINPNSGNNNYFFDLFTLSGTANSGGGPNNYLGDVGNPKIGASPLNSDNTRGFEVAIPKSAIGYTGGTLKVMAMYIADNGFLSNQFLTVAGSGQGNYGNGPVNFVTEPPNPITIPNLNLNNYGTNTGMVTVGLEGLLVKNPGDSGFNSLRSVYNCYSEGAGLITYDQQGMPPTSTTLLTTPLNISKSVTIQGLSNLARPEITMPASGMNIATGKTLTLQNVDVKSNGTATFTGDGTVQITGTTVGKE